MGRYPQKYVDLFWSKVQKKDGCWLWIGYRNPGGYGVAWDGKRTILAHRMSASMVGLRITNVSVLHSCDNPPCVQPDHLSIGDQSRNLREASERGRIPRGSDSVNSLLTESDVRRIRVLNTRRRSQRNLAREFGVSRGCIRHVLDGSTWGWM